MIVLDYRDRRPLYEQVTEKLEELMFSGVLPVGQPSAVGAQYGNGAFH